MTSAAFTIPAGVPFAQSLARGLKGMAGDDPLALAGMIVLLPTRRSARALTEAFLRVTEGQALLLPRLIALADIEQGQPEIAADLDDDGDDDETPPAIDWQRRRLILARLVMSRADLAPPPDQALALADGLAALIDETLTEERDFAALADLAPEQFAGHWQKTLEFLSIVTAHWPLVLDQENAIDPAAARIRALDARARRWRRSPPSGPVIAAGFVSADPALARLIRVVTELPQGRVVLPGLDQHLDNLAWDAIGPTHPQCGLKRLLDAIGVDRRAVALWPWVDRAALAAGAARVRLLSEALRPAETTQSWRQDKVVDPAALAGIDRIACGTAGEEAEVIALALRAALETPGRTAALVTPDRGLARRVAAALGRWDVAVDDSAGRKLAETPVGIWLRLVAEAMAGGLAPRPLLAMLKHPLASGGRAPHEFRRMVRALEIAVLRGPRPAPGLDGLVRALEQTAEDRVAQTGIDKAAVRAWLADFTARLAPLAELAALRSAPLAALLRAHAEAAEAFAATDSENGGLRLWRGPDGEAAAELFATLEGPAGAAMPAIEIARYPALLAALMEGIVVRPLYGVHPRLSIWGLIEARLQQADLVILGGLNEGTWPALPGDEPWMSRPMREGFGLPSPDMRIGQAAHDFAMAAAAPRVLLTRAERVDGAPTVPARFLSRLDTLLKSAGLALPESPGRPWRQWAEAIDRPAAHEPWDRPAPCPPLNARPRRLSVTAIETWMRNPYALYAKEILGLRPLDPLDSDPGAAERGQFVHEALDLFIRAHPGRLPDNALATLLALGRQAFGDILAHPTVAAFWWPRFARVADWFIAWEGERRAAGIRPIRTETWGKLDFPFPAGIFRLVAKADRVDALPDGTLAIIDYKTGTPPKARDVLSGYAPQLPLEGIIAEAGGFDDIPAAVVSDLLFLRLSGGNPPGETSSALGGAPAPAAIAEARAGLIGLVAAYDEPEARYPARPRPEMAYEGDYAHLERIQEWSADG